MIHLNSNLLCAVAIQTTGPDAQKHELLEIAVIPLNEKCEIKKKGLPFNVMIKPEYPQRAEYNIPNDYLMHVCKVGFDKYDAADLFEKWFYKLELKDNKRIMVLAHDWAFKRDFIKEWLQPTAFSTCFDTRYRDTQAIGLFYNDYFDRLAEPCPFPKVALSYMSAMRRIDYNKINNVIDECDTVVKLYRNLIGTRVL